MANNPWMKFYPRDWRGDQALRAVSIAARGLWMECLCIMHEAAPYGHLMLNGKPVEDDTLARMAGVSVDEVRSLLGELQQAGVLSVTRKGVIFSRRMTKDHALSQKGRAAVKKRWENKESDTVEISENKKKKYEPNRFPSREATTQKPEARKKEREPEGSLKKKTGCRLRGDWVLPKDWGDWAVERGMPEARVRIEAEKFANYWWGLSGARSVKADWLATWRNWVIKAVDDAGPSSSALPRRDSEQGSVKLTIDGRPNRYAQYL